MVPKRPFQYEEFDFPESKRRDSQDEDDEEELEFPVPESRRRPLLNVVRDVLRDGPVNEKAWENFFRPVVRDEIEKAFLHFLGAFPAFPSRPPLQIGSTSAASGLQLHFVNRFPPPTIFTGSRVETKDRKPLQIVLRDARTQNVVCVGPLSSLKIEVLVLSSEFGSDDQEDWSEREFNDGLVREREGKRPLVTGDITLNLRGGMCFLDDIVFTDNSSWIRSRKFRLGVKVVSSTDGVRIREAISIPFVVKDHRGESYKKNYPPSLNDEIWRLEKIAKDGAFHTRLSKYGITSVRHLLQSYVQDPISLRNIFGSVSTKTWSKIIEHATTCDIDDHRLYAYHTAEHDISLLFNAIYKFVGAMIGNQFCSLDELSPPQKALVENMKQQAYQTYRNVENMVLVDASAVLGIGRPLASLQAEPFSVPNSDMQQIEFQFTQQDEPSMELFFNQASTSTSYPYRAEGNNQFVVSRTPTSHPIPVFTPGVRNSFSAEDFGSVHFNGENYWPHSSSDGPIAPTSHVGTTEILFSTWSPPMNTTWGGQGNGFCFGPSSDIDAGIPSFVHNSGTRRKPKARWCKLRAAIKWWVSVRTRRMARPKYLVC